MGTKLNLFDAGLLDVSESLPHVATEDSVEEQFKLDSAVVESQVIEKNMEEDIAGLEDAQDVLEEMKEVIVKHEANVQSMNGQEVGGEATTESGEVVAEVPAEQQPQVDQNSSNEEVAEQNQDMQQGVESICGRAFNTSAEEVFKALKINNPYIGMSAGLNSIKGTSARIAYEEGLNGVKELASKIWFKVKAMIQSLIQWISKWVHKALIWIKGYESKAKKLKEEAQKLDDNGKAKEDFQFTQFASLLVKEPKLLDIKGIYGDIKSISGDSGVAKMAISAAVNSIKSGGSSGGNVNTNTNAEGGNNSISFYNRGLLNDGGSTPEGNNSGQTSANDNTNKPDSSTTNKAAEASKDVLLSGLKNLKIIPSIANHAKEKPVLDSQSFKIPVGMNNMKSFTMAKVESKEGEFNLTFENVEYFEKAPEKSEINTHITGKWAKDEIIKICDAITSSISEIKGTLDKGNSAINKIRNDVFKDNSGDGADSKNISYIGKVVIACSKLSQKALVCAAYAPSYYLNACSEYLKSINGGSSSGSDDKSGEGAKKPDEKTEK